MRKKKYYKKTYMEYPIKCEVNYPCYLGILSKLMKVIQVGKLKYTRPIGFHIRYRLKDSVDGRVVTDRLSKYLSTPGPHRKKSNTFKPYWLKVSELDPDQDGLHHHMALIIDGKKAKKASLHCFFANLKKNGYLDNYFIVEPHDEMYTAGVCLKQESGVAYFFNWLSYIAKVSSKDFIHQTYSSSRVA
jgi:hypothetical protein